MKQAFLLCITILLSESIIAQTIIRGSVKDESGEEIVGANIYLEGTYDGTTSGVDGSFEFSTYETGDHILIVSFIGYENNKRPLNLDGKEYSFEIILSESVNQMKTIVITAGTFEASDQSKNEVLRPLDIVTTAGATADIAGALNTLPGTQTVGEEGRLFVRGGDAYETTTFIDGMLVIDSYERTVPNVPTRSRFSPMMFKGASFSTGGYSAEYGQGLSSALILNTNSDKRTYLLDYTLDTIESMLNPAFFFRINRKYIVSFTSINDIIAYSNSRLRLILNNCDDSEVIVARDRVGTFKPWLDR